MKHRFRYLDEQGQQIEVVDLSALREHVHAGRVDDDTLLYDGLTDEWAPASAHSAYRLLDDPLARDAEATGETPPAKDGPGQEEDEEGAAGEGAPAGPPPVDRPAAGNDFDFPDLGVTLAPDDVIESTDQVVEKLLRERERDRGADLLPSVTGDYAGRPPVASPEEPPGEEDRRSERRRPGGPRPPDPGDEPIRPRRRRRPRRTDSAAARKPARSKRPRPPVGGRYRVEVPRSVVAVAAVLFVALGFYGASRLLNPSGAAEASTGAGDAADGAARTQANSTWAAAEGGAFQDMVEGVDSLRGVHSVQRIPDAWLAGPYLADADRYPDVREYWENYLRFVDAVRSQDTVLFRRSFVSRLQDQDVSGPIVPIRLARALETFESTQPARDTVYARMEDLASSALDLHELLVDRSDDLVHDPVTEERTSRQPILEAWSDDEYLRESIWALLDRITANLALLEYDAGSGRSDLTERLFQELRTRSVGPGGDDAGG